MNGRHPVRLVVADDLRRSRLTVFFRLLLTIPHFIWLALLGIAALVVAFLNWWATLFRGSSPRAFHDFLAGYTQYATRVEGYLALAANPFPPFFAGSRMSPYPVDVEIDPPAPQNRWKTGFRIVLFIPASLMAGALAGGGGGVGRSSGYGFSAGVVATVGCLIWFAALARARAPRGLRDLACWGIGYAAQTTAYFFLLTDRYPYSGPEGHLTDAAPAECAEGRARLVVRDDLRRSRLTVFFRLLLVVPHIVWLTLWSVVALLAAVASWVATLVTGRAPGALARFLGAYTRYGVHVTAFLYLIGNPFPGFVGAAGSYPVDAELVVAERQNRWVTGFRLLLAVPALMVSSALGSVTLAAAFLGWFASLARAEMPEGLRNSGAQSLRYNAQLWSYLLLLTDRYPFGGPLVAEPAPPPPLEPVGSSI